MTHPTENGIITHDQPMPYGDDITYKLGAEFLADCPQVEDWGCGRGWARQFFRQDQYRGIDMGVDGQPADNPFADTVTNLSMFYTVTDGIFMRHVLEHNYDWERILTNARESAMQKIFIAVFTPMSEGDTVELWNHGTRVPGLIVPTLSLSRTKLMGSFKGCKKVESTTVNTATHFGYETIFYITR